MRWAIELDRKVNFNALLAYDEKTSKADIKEVGGLARQLFRNVSEYRYDSPHEESWPLAPNHAWQRVAWHIYNNNLKDFWFWWEADAVPLRPRWLDDIAAAHAAGKQPFAGHIVEGMGHFNGVAVYPWNVCDYACKALYCRAGAWDYVLKEETAGKVTPLNDLISHCWNLDEKGYATNDTNGNTRPPCFRTEEEMLKVVDFNAGLFHRCKDGSLIDRIKEHNAHKLEGIAPIKTGAELTAANVPAFVRTTTPVKAAVGELIIRVDPAPDTEILIVSYAKDYPWLKYSLKSTLKYAKGFHAITVVVPRKSEAQFAHLCEAYDVRLQLFDEAEDKGRTHQQIIKCLADQYVTTEAEYIFHMDSDCIWHTPSTPGNYFHDGKPIYVIRPYDSLYDAEKQVNSDCYQWKAVAEKALGFEIKQYTMCRHPTVFPRWLYPEFRNWIECQQKAPFTEWVLAQHKPFPDGFAEFPTIGAFAYEFYHQEFHWVDCAKEPDAQPDRMKNFWSHGGLLPDIKAQIEEWLK